jgi:hypothetical protein
LFFRDFKYRFSWHRQLVQPFNLLVTN